MLTKYISLWKIINPKPIKEMTKLTIMTREERVQQAKDRGVSIFILDGVVEFDDVDYSKKERKEEPVRELTATELSKLNNLKF